MYFDMFVDEQGYIRDDLCRLNTDYGLIAYLFLFYNYGERVLKHIPMSFRILKCIDYGAHQAEYIDETYEKIGTGSIS